MHKTYLDWLNDYKPKIFCKCGYNKEIIIKLFHKCGGIPKFIHGHQSVGIKQSKNKNSESHKGQVPWNKGIKLTEEQIKKNSESHKGQVPWNKGKIDIYSEEYRNKISKTRIERDVSKGKNNPMYDISRFGKDSPAWKGGISFEPYCEKFNNQLKEKIRNRDNRICQNCGKTELDNKQKLCVHHIHYDKSNCNPDLISLCRCCNIKVNTNRDYYEEYFINKLKERGYYE